MSKALHIPFDKRLLEIQDIPFTISYVIRKRQQIDNLNELPKDKRPSLRMIFDNSSDELSDWIDEVMNIKNNSSDIVFYEDEVE